MSPFDAALPSTEDLFSVIEAIHDNVAIVDHNGVMRWVSSCFERNYGISRDRVIGRPTYELEAEKVFSPSVATLTEATRSGQYNIVTGVPIYDDDGDVSFVVSYSVDMRYSRRLHEEYQKISALVSPNAPQTSGGLPFSGTMRAIAATIEKLAKVNTTVLITGESGVGSTSASRSWFVAATSRKSMDCTGGQGHAVPRRDRRTAPAAPVQAVAGDPGKADRQARRGKARFH